MSVANLEVRIGRRAAQEIETIDTWWRENRPAAPDMFLAELREAFVRISALPTLLRMREGDTYGSYLLVRSRYHVYARVEGEFLFVAAVWHASRGEGPGL
ncbi:MAG: type II toxin-antitoxin system RelE/ParE family toxin [Polyangiaceae bacterium]|nr:type II toxin-antitoxin system RelE/ParE family toxin [Polyangiaceae bacterium]